MKTAIDTNRRRPQFTQWTEFASFDHFYCEHLTNKMTGYYNPIGMNGITHKLSKWHAKHSHEWELTFRVQWQSMSVRGSSLLLLIACIGRRIARIGHSIISGGSYLMILWYNSVQRRSRVSFWVSTLEMWFTSGKTFICHANKPNQKKKRYVGGGVEAK